MTSDEALKTCTWCAKGVPVVQLDEDGVLSSVSGRPGKPSHAVDDFWWPCPSELAEIAPSSPEWDAIWESGRPQRYWPSEDVVRFGAARLPGQATPYWRVLEAGCGNGANLWYFLSRAMLTFGVDCSSAALAQAEKLCEMAKPEGMTRLGLCRGHLGKLTDALSILNPPTGYFDAVVDCRASQHARWSEHEAIYCEYFQLLKPGGWLFLLHMDNAIDDALLNDHLKMPGEAFTWTNIERGVYPMNGRVCMPPGSELHRVLQLAGFSIELYEAHHRMRFDGPQRSSLAAHSIFHAQRPAK